MRPGASGTTVILLNMRPNLFKYVESDTILLVKDGSGQLHKGNKCRERADRGDVKMDSSLRGFLELLFLHSEPLGGKDDVKITLFEKPVERFNWRADLTKPTKVEVIKWKRTCNE
jgi:hypothetical protein